MSFNGSGTFAINSTGQPVVSGTVISSSTFNALTADLATGLSTCITKDGQTTVTANIPMNSYKITGLAAGTAATDAARVGQLQAGGATLVTVAGTDTYTGTMSPSLGAYAAGNVFTFVVPNTNTTAATLNIDGLGAKALTRDGLTALVAGDLVATAEVAVVYDGTRFQVLNSNSKTNFNLSGTLTVAGNTTLSGGTANGVAYLNASKVLTTGSALTFDGTNLGIGRTPSYPLDVAGTARFGATSTLLTYVTNNGVTNTMVQIGDNPTFGAGTAYGLNSSSQYLYGQVAGVEGMRLTSTGLGIGTSSPSYKLVISNAGAQGFEFDPSSGLMQVYNRSTSAYGEFRPYGSLMRFYTGTSPTETMRLDSSGNLLVGTTALTSAERVKIEKNNPTNGLVLYVKNSASSAQTGAKIGFEQAGITAWWMGTNAAEDAFVWNRFGAGTYPEAMRLDTSGNLRVGTTSYLVSATEKVSVDAGATNGLSTKTSGGASSWNYFAWNSATSGNNGFIEFGTEGTYTARGSITYNRAGGLTAYNTTSDYRAKTITGPVTDSGSVIDSVPVYMGKMKDATQERPMFIAHETPPYAHTGEKDAVDTNGNPVYQQMDASSLVPIMWAEIQSLRVRLNALENK